jgi:hypothetical protein
MMLNCTWATELTKYDCRPVLGLDGETGLEIGTPFSMPDGSAINLYLMPAGRHILLSDNGDTLAHLSGMGLDVWQAMRLRSLRDAASTHKLTLTDSGDFQMLARPEHAAFSFAQAITGLLAISNWASGQMKIEAKEHDLVAEAEPYIVARNPTANFIKRPKIRGASSAEHVFDFQHGNDLIDVISPNAASTGGVMRKVGDVINGPFLLNLTPLIIVDDRQDPKRANNEIGILASLARAQTFTSLTRSFH